MQGIKTLTLIIVVFLVSCGESKQEKTKKALAKSLEHEDGRFNPDEEKNVQWNTKDSLRFSTVALKEIALKSIFKDNIVTCKSEGQDLYIELEQGNKEILNTPLSVPNGLHGFLAQGFTLESPEVLNSGTLYTFTKKGSVVKMFEDEVVYAEITTGGEVLRYGFEIGQPIHAFFSKLCENKELIHQDSVKYKSVLLCDKTMSSYQKFHFNDSVLIGVEVHSKKHPVYKIK